MKGILKNLTRFNEKLEEWIEIEKIKR
jgi:hypothetical protein